MPAFCAMALMISCIARSLQNRFKLETFVPNYLSGWAADRQDIVVPIRDFGGSSLGMSRFARQQISSKCCHSKERFSKESVVMGADLIDEDICRCAIATFRHWQRRKNLAVPIACKHFDFFENALRIKS